MDTNKQLPVLRVHPRDLAPRALVVGDPQRAADAAQMLGKAKEVGNWREYRTFTGEYGGKRITVSSHGVGSAGAAVCFEELIHGGVKTLIRAGTCGAMVEEIDDGEFIIATGAVREDGTTPQLVPLSYPAIADRHVISALEAAAVAQGYPKPHMGIARTGAAFYPGVLPPQLEMWMAAGVVCVEMELATLLVIASLRGARAGGILVSDGNIPRALKVMKAGEVLDPFSYNPHREAVREGVRIMLRIALESLSQLE